MNRHERRAREAQTRRDERLVREAPAGTIPPEMVPDFFKGTAWQLSQLEFHGLPDIGGHCIFHTLAAYQAVRACGVDAAIGIGGLLARVGPDERRDVIAFCGGPNIGKVLPNGNAIFHCWLRYRDWIFDSSVGDWSRIDVPGTEIEGSGEALPPVQWTISLPKYLCGHQADLALAWRPLGAPELGKVWYCPFYGDTGAIMQRIRQAHEEVGQVIADGRAKIFNHYCEHKGISRRRDGRVYPLNFKSISIVPIGTA